MKRLSKKQRDFDDNHYTFLTDSISNNIGIKTFQLEENTINKYILLMKKNLELTVEGLKIGNFSTLINGVITLALSMLIIYMSAILIINGSLTLGAMISFNTYINILFSVISKIWGYRLTLQSVIISSERINEIYSSEIENVDDEIDINCKFSSLVLDNVCFKYLNTETPVLHNLNISIKKNGLFSIVGSNGCGKSTIAKLVVRLYKENNGNIYVNRENVDNFPLKQLRHGITYIVKDDFFLLDTIKNNLLFACPNCSENLIEDACRKAGIHDFIMSSDKYDTVMDEKTNNLSSGQKQKLSIARALLKNSSIIIFDESTSNLDGKSENSTIDILHELKQSHIVFFISHTLSVIVDSNEIFVIKNGCVEEHGKHDYLMEYSEEYRRLFGMSPDNKNGVAI